MQKVAQTWEKVRKSSRTWEGSWSKEEEEEDSRTSKGAHSQEGKKSSGGSVF